MTLGRPPFGNTLGLAAAARLPQSLVGAPKQQADVPWQRAWDWFDRLNDLQTVAFLCTVVLGLATTACLIFAISFAPHPPAPMSASSSALAPMERPALGARPLGPAPAMAQAAAPAQPVAVPVRVEDRGELQMHHVAQAVNLRAAPGTAAPVLTTLSAASEVWLTGQTAQEGNATWKRVRTQDGREGWIIATVVD